MIDSRGEFFIQMENPVETADLKDAWDKQYLLRYVLLSFFFFFLEVIFALFVDLFIENRVKLLLSWLLWVVGNYSFFYD